MPRSSVAQPNLRVITGGANTAAQEETLTAGSAELIGMPAATNTAGMIRFDFPNLPFEALSSGSGVIISTFDFSVPSAASAALEAYSDWTLEGHSDPGLGFREDATMSEGGEMADPTREEFDAKLATVEARTETRFVELSGKIDRVADSISTLTSTLTGLRSELGEVKTEVKEDAKFTRWTIGVTIVASLIAFAAALWVTQGNLLSAFQAGLTLKTEQAPVPLPSPSTKKTN